MLSHSTYLSRTLRDVLLLFPAGSCTNIQGRNKNGTSCKGYKYIAIQTYTKQTLQCQLIQFFIYHTTAPFTTFYNNELVQLSTGQLTKHCIGVKKIKFKSTQSRCIIQNTTRSASYTNQDTKQHFFCNKINSIIGQNADVRYISFTMSAGSVHKHMPGMHFSIIMTGTGGQLYQVAFESSILPCHYSHPTVKQFSMCSNGCLLCVYIHITDIVKEATLSMQHCE